LGEEPILLDGANYQVIGVTPRDFVFRDRRRDFFIPIHVTPQFRATRDSHFLNVVARLKPSVTMRQASDDMLAIANHLKQLYPDSNRYTGASVVPIKEDLLGGTRTTLIVLMSAAGFVLLIACANLASLLLARAVARKRELAVRAALGARRGRLIRQMITEGALLSLFGGATGLALSLAGMRILATKHLERSGSCSDGQRTRPQGPNPAILKLASPTKSGLNICSGLLRPRGCPVFCW
jgi:putative ABC transport system permease protein